jgi:hypothetical protein
VPHPRQPWSSVRPKFHIKVSLFLSLCVSLTRTPCLSDLAASIAEVVYGSIAEVTLAVTVTSTVSISISISSLALHIRSIPLRTLHASRPSVSYRRFEIFQFAPFIKWFWFSEIGDCGFPFPNFHLSLAASYPGYTCLILLISLRGSSVI